MNDNAAWLLLSFAIMVVAVLARLSDKVEKLEKRLNRLEPADGDEPGIAPDDVPVGVSSARRRTPSDVA
jgi:hypothetical protein